MTITARLNIGESLGDRVMKVDHAGEHGAVCIYRVQKWFARWRAPDMVGDLDHFIAHERGHRALFGQELLRRGQRRCRSYLWCGLGGFVLGAITGLAGRHAIAATTVAIERVVLTHMYEQIEALAGIDQEAVAILRHIILEEQEHHDVSLASMNPHGFWRRLLEPVVGLSTHAVIWLGMNLRNR
ncbi:demethoxyubiquinone hydroxylase family protein [Sphingobium sp. WCS2017Hpa-17]|uniref:demethoxyubiquinone hydroxylase family protein n=1 Tax=Sphingobium sp. WCS2017Hpa-17 TaxID=3073638 RepID=UPI00288B84EE|nr:demethoxyubiquinone hydroxylase family protein [Sphingobium sp. WCS2017Hpa-17]